MLVGPSGYGKSALARKIARDFATRDDPRTAHRVHFCFWPYRIKHEIDRGDLVVIDNLSLAASEDYDQLAWIAELRCAVLITTAERRTAKCVLGVCAEQRNADGRLIEIGRLDDQESLALLKTIVPEEDIERKEKKKKKYDTATAALSKLEGSPFYLKILAEVILKGAMPSADSTPAGFRTSLAKAWVRSMRESHPEEYKILRILSLIPHIGTSVTYIARLAKSGREAVQAASTRW